MAMRKPDNEKFDYRVIKFVDAGRLEPGESKEVTVEWGQDLGTDVYHYHVGPLVAAPKLQVQKEHPERERLKLTFFNSGPESVPLTHLLCRAWGV